MRRRKKGKKKNLITSFLKIRQQAKEYCLSKFSNSEASSFLASCAINASVISAFCFFSFSAPVKNFIKQEVTSFGFFLEEEEAIPFPQENSAGGGGGFAVEAIIPPAENATSVTDEIVTSITSVNAGLFVPDFTQVRHSLGTLHSESVQAVNSTLMNVVATSTQVNSNGNGSGEGSGSGSGAGSGEGSGIGDGSGSGVAGKRIGRMFVEGEKIGVVLDVSGSMDRNRSVQMSRARRLASNRDLIIELDGCAYGQCRNSFTSMRTIVSEAFAELVEKGADAIYHISDLQDGQDASYINALRSLFLENNVRLYISSWDIDASPELRSLIRDSGGSFELNGRLISLSEE